MITHICDLTPSDGEPESARALLYRHGLPEDIIDGVLCLHAQELAAVSPPPAIRAEVLAEAADIVVNAFHGEPFLSYPPDFADLLRQKIDEKSSPAEAQQECPGVETVPNRCTCGCEGCKHHCGAHDPSTVADEARQQPDTDRAALRDRIAQALHDQMPGCAHDEHGNDCAVLADAVLAVLPPLADRAALLPGCLVLAASSAEREEVDG